MSLLGVPRCTGSWASILHGREFKEIVLGPTVVEGEGLGLGLHVNISRVGRTGAGGGDGRGWSEGMVACSSSPCFERMRTMATIRATLITMY